MQDRVFIPSIFIAQDPHTPWAHDLLKVRDESISFLILFKISKTLFPHVSRLTSKVSSLGFSLFSGSDSLALKVVKHGGAGAITATSNISAKLLSFIINNYKEEFTIDNFKELQLLQEQIRKTLFTHEPISALKAFMSVKYRNYEWNRINPPLIKISNPENHKTIIGLIELIDKMDQLVPVT